MPVFSRQQLIAWAAVGLVVLLVGANYLRGQLQNSPQAENQTFTVGLKDDTPVRIKVHLAGAVVRPGLYELDAGLRVADALQLAGGPLPSADLHAVNLAAKLADGQQLLVPEQGANAGNTGGERPASQLSLNAATLDELITLDGVGPKTAQRIIDYRQQHGGFQSVEELQEVSGIGPAKFEQIKDKVAP